LAARYARRTLRLTATIGQLAIRLAGRTLCGRVVRTWRGGVALDGVAGADGAADPAGADTDGAQRRRCRAPPRLPLCDRADRRGHPPAGRRAARPPGRHVDDVAVRASRRRGRLSRRVGRLRRGDPPGRTPGGAGQRPLALVARPGRGGGEDRHRAQHLLANSAAAAAVAAAATVAARAGDQRADPGPARGRARAARPGRGPARMCTPVGLGVEHRQALHPRRHRRTAAAATTLRPHPGRPLP